MHLITYDLVPQAKKYGLHRVSNGEEILRLRERRKCRQRMISVTIHSWKCQPCFDWQIIGQLNE